MTENFFIVFTGLVLVELTKGLSANGTPPVLQRFSWQMDLAYFLWSNILFFRLAFVIAIVWMFVQIPAEARMGVVPGGVVLAALWGFIYWLFNRYWVGRFKFLPITRKIFEKAAANKVGMKEQVLGISYGGEQKAFPVNMLYYHHQIADEVGGHPIWPTYCVCATAGGSMTGWWMARRWNSRLSGRSTTTPLPRSHHRQLVAPGSRRRDQGAAEGSCHGRPSLRADEP